MCRFWHKNAAVIYQSNFRKRIRRFGPETPFSLFLGRVTWTPETYWIARIAWQGQHFRYLTCLSFVHKIKKSQEEQKGPKVGRITWTPVLGVHVARLRPNRGHGGGPTLGNPIYQGKGGQFGGISWLSAAGSRGPPNITRIWLLHRRCGDFGEKRTVIYQSTFV